MNALEKVYFATSIRKDPEDHDVERWKSLWYNSELLQKPMREMIEHVRGGARFKFRVRPLEHPSDWDDDHLVMAYFDDKECHLEDYHWEGPYWPMNGDEHIWWIRNNSRYRFVFGPFYWFGSDGMKKVYKKLRRYQGTRVSVEGNEGTAEDNDQDEENDGAEADNEMSADSGGRINSVESEADGDASISNSTDSSDSSDASSDDESDGPPDETDIIAGVEQEPYQNRLAVWPRPWFTRESSWYDDPSTTNQTWIRFNPEGENELYTIFETDFPHELPT